MFELNQAIEVMRRDRSLLLAEAESAGAVRKGRAWSCWHGDKHPSAGPYLKNGIERFKCHGCGFNGDVFDIRAHRTGRSRSELIREEIAAMQPTGTTAPSRNWEAIARASYSALSDQERGTFGDTLGLSGSSLNVLRVGRIRADELRCLSTDPGEHEFAYTFPMRNARREIIGIRLRFPDGSKKSITGSASGLFIPVCHNIPEGRLFIVEGPTDDAAMLDMGIFAVGRPSNASGTNHLVEFCRLNPREFVIVPQNDKPGSVAQKQTETAAEHLANEIKEMGSPVTIIRPAPEHKDVRDWKRAGADTDDIEAAIDGARPPTTANLLAERYAAVADGSYSAIPFPGFPCLSRGTQAFTPASVTILAGGAGSTKSMFLVQCIAGWEAMNIPVACLMLEKDTAFHVNRALAQRAGCANLTNLEWLKANADEAAYLLDMHREFVDRMGKVIDDTTSNTTTLNDVATWIERMAVAGKRIIMVDPITLADAGMYRWIADAQFMRKVGKILTRSGASLFITSHPPKNTKGPITLDHIAGGSAYARAADCVLFLSSHEEPKSVTIKPIVDDGDIASVFPMVRQESVNREISILKAREARGTGWRIGFVFQGSSLMFQERGPIKRVRAPHEERRDASEIA